MQHYRSTSPLTPKLWAALQLILQSLQRGEQTVVFAPFLDPLDALKDFLLEAGVSVQGMDGRRTPADRGRISSGFKQRKNAVLLCGTESCAEGYSWPDANNMILLAYSWALDKMLQAVDRCRRLDSKRDLNYHVILCEGSVDHELFGNLHEKENTSDLVLDGQLSDENPHEVSLGEILQCARSEFDAETRTIDERVLEQEWPALREALRSGYQRWMTGAAEGTAGGKLQVTDCKPVDSQPSTFNLQPATSRMQPSTPLLAFPTPLHPWRERALRRRNLKAQQELAFA